MNVGPTQNDPWEVFEYEADQFTAMCNLLPQDNQKPAAFPPEVMNAIVESALLHTRQLADIFLSRGKEPDNIKLEDLVQQYQPKKLDALRQAYGSTRDSNTPCWVLNKRLAHPTTWRSQSYDYSSLLNKLAPLLENIIQEIRIKSAPGSQSIHKPTWGIPPNLSGKTGS